MADKREHPAQEVQKANRPIENGCRQEQETDPRKIAADLYAKTQEIEILLSRGSNPDRIAHCYKSAAADARRIAELTGNVKYLHYAAQLEQGAEISPFTEQTAEPDNHSYIFTPDGKEYVLPEQEAEYMRDNPIAAAILADEQKQAAQEVRHITIDISNIDPRTDPNSPEFDIEIWKAALNAAGGIEAARERMEAVMRHLQQTVLSSTEQITQTTGIAEIVAENLQRTVSNAIKSITAFINSDAYKAIKDNMALFSEYIEQNREEIAAAADNIEAMQELTPYIQDELEALKNDPAFAHASITDIMQHGTDADGNPTESKWQMILAAARERKAAADAEREAQKEEPAQGAQEVQENPVSMQLQFFEHDAEQQEEPAQEVQEATKEEKQPSKLKNAEQSGAIMTIGERLFAPSDEEYQNALMTSINANAGIFRRKMVDGKPGKRELALDVQFPIIQALAKTVLISHISGVKNDIGIEVYFPSFIKELGIDLSRNHFTDMGEKGADLTRADARREYVFDLISAINDVWGVLPNDVTEYKVVSVLAYNPDTEILYVDAPYLRQLIGAMAQKEKRQLSNGAKYYNWSCDLMHSSAANERNQAAVEMATRLLVGVQQRGMTPDSKLKQNRNRSFTEENKGRVTWEITCAGLIDECPQIREKLKQQKTASEKTQTMKRTFTAMYRILKKKTDLLSYYTDVSITEVVPTTKTINSKITITHSGGNPKYKRPYLPLIEEQPQELQPDTEEPEN